MNTSATNQTPTQSAPAAAGDGVAREEDSAILLFPQPNGPDRDRQDALILQRLSQGDTTAAGDLWRNFSCGLLTLIFRILEDRQEAEDVLQEAMLRLWEKASLYDASKGRAFVWAAMIARGLAIDALRKRQRREKLLRGALEHRHGEPQSRPQDEANALEWMELALSKLSATDRQVVREVVLVGRTSVELASAAGESDVTIRSRLRRALARLREIIQNDKLYGKER